LKTKLYCLTPSHDQLQSTFFFKISSLAQITNGSSESY
jgi:hypothetical protein